MAFKARKINNNLITGCFLFPKWNYSKMM
jgi:hypothetical protein